MKVIHTADWHLGKVLNGHSFLEDQCAILEEFVKKVEKENPDVLIIAGDIFDTAMPSKRAIELMERTIARLNIDLKIPMIITNGNHDGKERLRYGAHWFKQNQLYIRTELVDFEKPITLGNVCFYTLPFFTLAEARAFLGVEVSTYEETITQLVERIKPQIDASKQNVLIGHFTLFGAPKSDSERELTVGTIESVRPHCVSLFDAVMLGHIHHPFALNQNDIYYSGSLLQYSFSEVNQTKGMRCFTFNKDDYTQTFIPLTSERQLQYVETTFDDAINGRFKHTNKDDYFHFSLSELEMVKDPMQQLKKVFPNTLALTQQEYVSTKHVKASHNIKKMKPIEIIDTFYKELMDDGLDEIQMKEVKAFLNHYEEEE
ncbi:exonuclease sbcCD subunit D [Staphylococcus hyicus]|uniref:exonuclease subunit SbcD n=1 Tax=Staphylococcus hyicus TaxID=1284 RepID=UPI000D1D7370|nr:exonuclease subunit SbcD [Staphylococcus hyicus]PTJ72147.1 exonuclease sbcCD subunit D [Staphylococcus hyicus]PTJ86875.1 exonuclease sbcCD subunit D [Staphylococcus hyicus]